MTPKRERESDDESDEHDAKSAKHGSDSESDVASDTETRERKHPDDTVLAERTMEGTRKTHVTQAELRELAIEASSDACDLKYDLLFSFPEEGCNLVSTLRKVMWPFGHDEHRRDDDTSSSDEDAEDDACDSSDDDEEDDNAKVSAYEKPYNPRGYDIRTNKWCVRHEFTAAGDSYIGVKHDCVLDTGSDEHTVGDGKIKTLVMWTHARDTRSPFFKWQNSYAFDVRNTDDESKKLFDLGVFPSFPMVMGYSSDGADESPNEVKAMFTPAE